MKLECRKCGEVFEERHADHIEEMVYSEYWGAGDYTTETTLACPWCGSTEIGEADEEEEKE